ncbi:MAG: hypothetical protein NVS3B5_18520 [Sphingomicrobium sp.]
MDNAPENLAVLRHMALNIMRKDTSKGSLRIKFNRAEFRSSVCAAFGSIFASRKFSMRFLSSHPLGSPL